MERREPESNVLSSGLNLLSSFNKSFNRASVVGESLCADATETNEKKANEQQISAASIFVFMLEESPGGVWKIAPD